MNNDIDELAEIAEDLNGFINKSRLCVTLAASGNSVRFENTVSRILDCGQLPEHLKYFIGVKFAKDVKAEFGLWKNRVIFFDPRKREWFGCSDSYKNKKLLMVEMVGLIYNYRDYYNPDTWCKGSIWHDNPIAFEHDKSAEMDRFEISISGHNIRAILFKKLYNNKWKNPAYTRENIMKVKDKDLIFVINKALQEKNPIFTLDELSVIRSYLWQHKTLNGSIL